MRLIEAALQTDPAMLAKLALRNGRPGAMDEREGLAESDALVEARLGGRRDGELEDVLLELDRKRDGHSERDPSGLSLSE